MGRIFSEVVTDQRTYVMLKLALLLLWSGAIV